jgi:hypothetical protein
LFWQLARQEVADDGRDLGPLAFQREMTGIEQMDFRVRVVTFEGLGAGRQEKRPAAEPAAAPDPDDADGVLVR